MEDLISLKNFASILGKPISTIRTWKRRGNLPPQIFVIIGSTVFVKKSEFDEWISKKVA